MAQDLAYTSGAIGCAKSHIDLWRMAVAQNRMITVAEDDTTYSKTFEAAASDLMAKLPAGWDYIAWGFNVDAFLWADLLPGVMSCEIHWDRSVASGQLKGFQTATSSPALFRLLHHFGTQGYSISAQGARKMLHHCLPLTNALIRFQNFPIAIENKGIDCVMNGLFPRINAYVSLPPLVAGDSVFSTVRQTEGQRS